MAHIFDYYNFKISNSFMSAISAFIFCDYVVKNEKLIAVVNEE